MLSIEELQCHLHQARDPVAFDESWFDCISIHQNLKGIWLSNSHKLGWVYMTIIWVNSYYCDDSWLKSISTIFLFYVRSCPTLIEWITWYAFHSVEQVFHKVQLDCKLHLLDLIEWNELKQHNHWFSQTNSMKLSKFIFILQWHSPRSTYFEQVGWNTRDYSARTGESLWRTVLHKINASSNLQSK